MPQPYDYDKTHLRNLAALQARIDRIFRQATEEAARIGASISAPLPADRLFSFDDFPRTQADIAKLTAWLQEAVEVAVVNGVRSAWTLSNNKNNALSRRIFGDRLHHLTKEQQRRYFTSNLPALDAFLQRTTAGLNLSDRVWRYTDAFKHEIEMALDLGIRTGESAAQMTRSLRQYLQHPDKLFRRVRDRHGLLRLSQAAKAFHPGTGVYRSSYRNARRLAATETNIAYRTADHLRWQQMDFVVGIEIQLSNNHTVLLQPGERTDDPTQQRAAGSPKANAVRPLIDICDTLAGRYPKDFKFTGWHPHCRCRAVTILKTDEELARDFDRILAGEPPLPSQLSANAVAAPPASFTQWLEKNATRIEAAQQRGTIPYFIKDNAKYIDPSNNEPSPKQFFTVYKTFSSVGSIHIMDGLDKKAIDYKALLTIAREFAREGSEVRITTKAHYKSDEYEAVFGTLSGTRYERKCPDLIIDGAFYEYEGFVRPWNKRKVGRMISHGAIQSDRIIIDNTNGCSHRFILTQIFNRLRDKNFNCPITEVWVYEKGQIQQLYPIKSRR